MKRFYLPLLLILIGVGIGIFPNSCLKDNCSSSYRYKMYIPVYQTLPDIRAAVKLEGPQPVENTGKIYFKDDFIYLNELGKGIHVIDDRNPASPQNIAFINIPGNMDMAVAGNILYADSYVDMLALDISDPRQVKITKRLDNVFPWRVSVSYGFGDKAIQQAVITSFIERDTTIQQDCNTGRGGGIYFDNVNGGLMVPQTFALSQGKAASPAALTGIGGSMARFAILKNYLYTVSNDSLSLFNISNPPDPLKQSSLSLGMWIETIFPYNDHLFIGSQIGMYIFDASNPGNPVKEGTLLHDIMSCDPVVAQGNTAYVTLRTGSGSICHNGINQLQVIDITHMDNPAMIATYNMTNPQGLAIDGDKLIVCEGKGGLDFLNAADPNHILTEK
ncbi:MAG TPA: hypothetical protein VIU45_05095, partial [Chitinophagaceae bacterium]